MAAKRCSSTGCKDKKVLQLIGIFTTSSSEKAGAWDE